MESIGLLSLPSHLRDNGDEDRPLSSVSNSRSEAAATGVTRSEETKSSEYLIWDRLKEQQVAGYGGQEISQWVEYQTKLEDKHVDEMVSIDSTYNNAEHTQIIDSTIHGGVTFQSSQTAIPSRHAIENLGR
jgi:hypothetical protein